jgi:hypothetical protein
LPVASCCQIDDHSFGSLAGLHNFSLPPLQSLAADR